MYKYLCIPGPVLVHVEYMFINAPNMQDLFLVLATFVLKQRYCNRPNG